VSVIYVADNDDSTRELVRYALESAGFTVKGFPAARPFFASLGGESGPDLVVFDANMPDTDCREALRRVKGRGGDIPVIITASRASEYDRVAGLDSGADDYVMKPFSVLELVSRVRAVLRRCRPAPSDLAFKDIVIDDARRTVTVAGLPVSLTRKEYDLLKFMVVNRGMALSRDTLLTRVWGFDYEGASRTLDIHIRALRRKLGQSGACVRTIHGVGYKLGD
jgi:two-component system alkaline phosphatase synthesis response regulator PhoP